MSKELIKLPDTAVTRKDIDDWLMGSGTKLTEPQKALFYQISSSFNLNPAKREIYAIPYGTGFNVIVGFEVYLKRAERSGMLEWWEATVEKRGDEWVGTCTIKRTDRSRPTTIEAWFNEYNQGNNMWKTKPRTMIRKVAIAQAFRMLFSDELGGMPYTSDETSVAPEMVELLSMETITENTAPEAPAPQVLDTSKFDKAVKKLKWDAETMTRLARWLEDTAVTAGNKAGKSYTADIIKLSASSTNPPTDSSFSNRWEEFLAKFKEWQDLNYPAPLPGVAPGTPPVQEDDAPPPDQGPDPGEEAPNMVNLVEQLAKKGWPVAKLQIKFGKPMADWGETELSMLADLSAELP